MLLIKSSTQIINPRSEKAHISSILTNISGKKGSVFGLIRFLGKSDTTRELISQTISDRLEAFKDTLEGDVHVARRFEQLLQALNEDIAQIISENKKPPISDAQIVIGVAYDNQVFLSGTENLVALFMHRTAKQRYVIYELSDQLVANEPPKWEKLFATVLDGELHPGDIFYIATKVSAREITHAQLQDILTTLPVSGALKRISQFLHSNTVYGGICFKISEKKKASALKKMNPTHSMEHLDKTKDETATILGDQSPDIGNFVSKLTGPLIKKLSAPGTRGYKSLLKRFVRITLQALTITLAVLLKITAFVFKYLIIGIQNIPGLVRKGKYVVQEQPNPKERLNALHDWFKRVPTFAKYTGLAAIVLILVVTTSLTVSSKRQAKAEQEATFNTIITHIEEKMDASQASLIYKDEEQARLHLQEASALLATIDAQDNEQSDITDNLTERLQEVLYEIQKITPVDTSIIASSDNIEIAHALEIDEAIYGISTDSKLYRLNSVESAWQIQETNTTSIEQIISSTATESGNILAIDSSQQLSLISTASNTITPVTSGIDQLLSAEDLIEYNDSIYVLSAAGEQIIKMRERGDGYEAGTAWINSTNSGANLNSARAIAIDGLIYILTNSDILSFLSGRQQTFTIDSISPEMSNATDIWTDPDSDYIYILEPSESRVIVIDKEGALVAQYVNDAIAESHSMIIQENNNSIVFVTNSAAYTFAASHLLQ